MRTHYDNLQVIEGACLEVIKGAHRYLSHKWHPDKNPNNVNLAERNMKIINEAYKVLSDPVQRQEHDDWIREQREKEQMEQQQQKIPPIPEFPNDMPPNIEVNNSDITVGSVRETIESTFCLPEGSVALCDPSGHHLRADAKIKTLRSRWGL